MSTFLSEGWFAGLESRLADRLARLDLDITVQCAISGGPDGDVKCYAVLGGGRLVEAGLGSRDTADLAVTIGYDDAASIDRGALDPSVAYMQGRMKVAGDNAKLLTLLPHLRP